MKQTLWRLTQGCCCLNTFSWNWMEHVAVMCISSLCPCPKGNNFMTAAWPLYFRNSDCFLLYRSVGGEVSEPGLISFLKNIQRNLIGSQFVTVWSWMGWGLGVWKNEDVLLRDNRSDYVVMSHTEAKNSMLQQRVGSTTSYSISQTGCF